MTRLIGYIIFAFSCLVWGAILVIPWLGFSKGKIAGIITVLVIVGEITFYVSIFLIGRSFYDKIKSKLAFWKKKPKDITIEEQEEQK
jgi:hypothetical protein